jgi:hypothetical protein
MTLVSGAVGQAASKSTGSIPSMSDSENDGATPTKQTKKQVDNKRKEQIASLSTKTLEPLELVPDTDFSTRALKTSPIERPKAAAVDESAQEAPKPASNGTNPAELITRIEVKYQYQNFAAGDLHAIAIVRGDYAITPKVAFRMDLPILHFNSKISGVPSESGIGDIVTSMTFVKIFSKKFVGAIVPRVDFPTATNSSLGSGKFVFKPTIAGITPLGKGIALVGLAEYRISFAGKQNRADINELSLKPIILKSFLTGPLKGFYANPQLDFVVDFENNNRTTTQFAVNMGKVLSKNVVAFVIPTFHIAGTKRENFKLEVGFRYLFR